MLGSYDDKKSMGTITTESKFNPDDTLESSLHYVNRQNGTKLEKSSTIKQPPQFNTYDDTYGTKNPRVTEADETSLESGISSSSTGKENQQRVVNSSTTAYE